MSAQHSGAKENVRLFKTVQRILAYAAFVVLFRNFENNLIVYGMVKYTVPKIIWISVAKPVRDGADATVQCLVFVPVTIATALSVGFYAEIIYCIRKGILIPKALHNEHTVTPLIIAVSWIMGLSF